MNTTRSMEWSRLLRYPTIYNIFYIQLTELMQEEVLRPDTNKEVKTKKQSFIFLYILNKYDDTASPYDKTETPIC